MRNKRGPHNVTTETFQNGPGSLAMYLARYTPSTAAPTKADGGFPKRRVKSVAHPKAKPTTAPPKPDVSAAHKRGLELVGRPHQSKAVEANKPATNGDTRSAAHRNALNRL